MKQIESEMLRGMEEIAEYMRCSRPTVHRYIHELGLPCINPGPGRGKRVMTTKTIVDMWILAVSKPADKFPIGGPPMMMIRRFRHAS